ncbi:acetyl/propionyl/methylcrotonyl-CoA carboxylase subunit alpha [Aliidiomarina quisquiliarum]|uniref:acetyl/propionyl/methylcrotonyl-CoA carboxylase subunit alpha n=1 Tax=Aliidiomarina quisquiliarum TaxID=2938947 RepID=UPI00208EF318|nr:acetyl/propionyl/methylcrotonyl-CoA carboxylase subunit alpha [Aliidiomarina quisquiliarum]MCO4321735.1 acetyl/propionyl/methylcrotonyl-CoA carboxylase subunit alpha [Aliidiomarina quisquiliarum]
MLNKVLIANRGEIACRIIHTAREMGIQTVAVYSDADRNAQHVKLADEAVHIGAAPSNESYLCIDKIIAAAKRTGAEAVHPGYGFLAENETFAEALEQAGLIFVGPPVAAIQAMGSKSAAKTIMAEADVPLVPGYHGDDQADDLLRAESDKMGYPVLLKAAYGGGGKGMRIVSQAREFDEALASARREAKAAFSNDKMLVEKYITQPRHVEIQVFCDQHGNAIYLAERDCSVQRRHQKVVEEAPAPGLTAETRQAMGEAAVRAAKAINYVGAGTVEFLLDSSGSFYFMEMNTRLQVEHPITEMITGVDLVDWQLRVAAGETLPMEQADVEFGGHAFEARIYAENPDDNFMPSTGILEHLRFPVESTYVRIDSGVIEGDEVSTFYDPMIAKVIVWDEDRASALRRLQLALRDTHIVGVTTNTDYIHRIATHPEFVKGNVSTHFIDDYAKDLVVHHSANDTADALAVIAVHAALQHQATVTSENPWDSLSGWQMNAPTHHPVNLLVSEELQNFSVTHTAQGYFVTELDRTVQLMDNHDVSVNGLRFAARFVACSKGYTLFTAKGRFDAAPYDALAELAHEEEAGTMTAPMNGTIVAVNVAAGDNVEEGQALVIMEAMKMEYTIRAPFNGVVEQVFFHAGELVSDGAELVSLAEAD